MAREFRRALLAAIATFGATEFRCGNAAAQAAPDIMGGAKSMGASAMAAYLGHLRAAPGQGRMHHAGQTPPEIISGKITTPTVNVTTAPAAPAMTLKYKAPAGVYYLQAGFTSSSGQSYIAFVNTNAPNYTSGQATLQDTYNQISLYAQPGTWTLSSLEIVDLDYGDSYYTGADLAALFPSLTIQVTNSGTPDVTPPVVTKGKILTPIVSLSSPQPYFEAQLTGSDDLSGVEYAYVYFAGPDYMQDAYGAPFAPFRKGSVVAGVNLAGGQTGTYTITEYQLCDAATNCLTDSNAADIKKLFGTTTFEVTN